MLYVDPRVSKASALQFFERRRFGNLWGILNRRPSVSEAGERRAPFAELVWLPHYMITVRVTSSRGPGEIVVSVEAHSGAFAILDTRDGLVEGEPEGGAFPPKLDEAEAVRIGRKELLRSIMRRRGQRHRPVIEDTLAIELFLYPYWVYYYERRKGLLDIQVLDAVTREKGRVRTKVGVLSAFVGSDDKARAALENR